KVPESKVDYVKTLGSNATAIAKQDDQIAIGTEDGSFMIIDRKGKILFEHKFTKEISAICPIKTTEGIRWAVAVCPENLKDGKASLHLIDESGRIAWKNDLTMWHFRNGTINTMFTAKLDGSGELAIIAGSQAWNYFAFSHRTGKQLWKAYIAHGAT